MCVASFGTVTGVLPTSVRVAGFSLQTEALRSKRRESGWAGVTSRKTPVLSVRVCRPAHSAVHSLSIIGRSIYSVPCLTQHTSKVTVFGLRTALFWVITQRAVVNPFLTTVYRIRYVQFCHLHNYVTDGGLLLKGPWTVLQFLSHVLTYRSEDGPSTGRN